MMVQSYLDNRNKYQDHDSLSHQSVVVAVTLPTIKMAHMSGTSDPSEVEASKFEGKARAAGLTGHENFLLVS